MKNRSKRYKEILKTTTTDKKISVKDVNKAYDMTRAEEEGDLDDGSGGK